MQAVQKADSMWHVLKECERTKQGEDLEKVLGEDGQKLKILRGMEKERRKEAKED